MGFVPGRSGDQAGNDAAMTDHARTVAARPPSGSPTDLLSRLRAETAAAHARLERELDLLSREVDRQRMLTVLERFHGFHAVWEGAMRRSSVGAFFEPRSRMTSLADDLSRLGLTPERISALPLCAAAAPLAATREAAVGSLYVMEGSTLGGQVIGRALADRDWAPPAGFRYFQPYGAHTGEMWRGFRDWAQTTTPQAGHDAVVAGAVATFETLHDWMADAADE